LVDRDRWRQIQRAFPNEIKERAEGKTAERIEQQIKEEKENIAKANAVAVCKQGEIQKEYEMMLARERERLRAEREQEEQESLHYIQRVIVSDFFKFIMTLKWSVKLVYGKRGIS
jgi:transposase